MSYDPTTLSRRCRVLLQAGEGWDRYDGTYKVLCALTGGMHRAGWTADQAVEALTDKGNKASQLLTAKYGGRLVSQIRSKYYASRRKAEQQRKLVNDWATAVVIHWPHGGRCGGTMRVALGLAAIAQDAGSLEFTASNLQIGEEAGVGAVSHGLGWTDTSSVRAAIDRLVQWGWIEREPVEHGSRLDNETLCHFRYRLASPERLRELLKTVHKIDAVSETPIKSEGQAWINGGAEDRRSISPFLVLHVIFEEAALGAAAGRVLALLLTHGPLSSRTVQRVLGMSRTGVNGCLRRLEESRLVEHDCDRSWRATGRSLDDVADEWNLLLRPATRRRSNCLHRENRRKYLAHARQVRRERLRRTERAPRTGRRSGQRKTHARVQLARQCPRPNAQRMAWAGRRPCQSNVGKRPAPSAPPRQPKRTSVRLVK